jgi:hypothetical protein
MNPELITKLESIPEGASVGFLNNKRYEISKKTTQGQTKRAISLQARGTGDGDYISLNWYPEVAGGTLKPCELPAQVCYDFLREVVFPID